MKKREEPLLHENSKYPGGATWVDYEYDPRFKVKVRFARTKAVGLWLRDHVLAGIIIAIVSLIVGIYIGRWLQPNQPQSPANTPAPTSSRSVS